MEWARILAYITGTVDHELLLRNEYLAARSATSSACGSGIRRNVRIDIRPHVPVARKGVIVVKF
jgi:hypothetical protein